MSALSKVAASGVFVDGWLGRIMSHEKIVSRGPVCAVRSGDPSPYVLPGGAASMAMRGSRR